MTTNTVKLINNGNSTMQKKKRRCLVLAKVHSAESATSILVITPGSKCKVLLERLKKKNKLNSSVRSTDTCHYGDR